MKAMTDATLRVRAKWLAEYRARVRSGFAILGELESLSEEVAQLMKQLGGVDWETVMWSRATKCDDHLHLSQRSLARRIQEVEGAFLEQGIHDPYAKVIAEIVQDDAQLLNVLEAVEEGPERLRELWAYKAMLLEQSCA
jgi:hypothetical protein